jgi:hypothetical protein
MAQQQIITANFPLDEYGRPVRPMPVMPINPDGSPASGASGTLPAGTDRSGTATTSSAQLAPANSARTFLVGQNVGANNIWINEFGATAVVGGAGSYKVIPGNSFNIQTNRQVNVIAETGNTAFTASEG